MKRFAGLLRKDIKVAFRNYYLLITFITAALLISLVNFAIPEEINMEMKMVYAVEIEGETETKARLGTLEQFLKMSPGNEKVAGRDEIVAKLKKDRELIGLILREENGQPTVEMVLQGHESPEMKKALQITLRSMMNAGQVQQENIQVVRLRDGEVEEIPFNLQMIPLMILLEPVMLGFVLIAALVFMEKEEETTKAYLVSPGRLPEYLASKIVLMMLIGLFSTFLITVFTLGWNVNWGWLILVVSIGSIFGSALGLLIGSLFDSISKAMVWIVGLSLVLSLPQVSYFIPGFAPWYVTLMPTYGLLFALKEILFPAGNMGLVYSSLLMTGGLGILLYILSIVSYNRTLGRD